MDQAYIVLPFVQFIICLVLISLVFMSAPSDRLNRLLAAFLLAMGLWGITIFGMRDSYPDADRAYFVEKIALAVIPFSSIFFYHFVYAFARIPRGRGVLYVFYGLGVLSAVFSLFGWTVTGMVPKFYGFAPDLGWAFPAVLLAAYPPVFLAIYDLTRGIGRAGDREQSQLRLLRLGALASVLGATSDYIPSLGLNIYPMGVIGNIAFGVLTTAAVTRYRMMELRLVLRRGLAYILISSSLLAVYGLLFIAVWFIARDQSRTALIIASVGTVFVAGLFVQPMLQRVQSFVDRVFFRERVDRLHAIVQLNADVRDITDFSLTALRVVRGIRRAVQSDWVTLVLPDPDETILLPRADSRGTSPDIELPADGAITAWFQRHHKPLPRGELQTDPYLQAMSEEEAGALGALDAVLLVPLLDRDRLIGILALGPKLAGDNYLAEDVEFLEAVAEQTGLAIQNARMFADEHERLSELERLANLKSNLLQTVSHELKSPITAIKISTELLEPAMSPKVPGARRERLIHTLKSGIDRLERLTQEALDYAAMQSAQLELQPVGIILEDVVREAASLLAPAIRARRQEFSIHADPNLSATFADSPRVERILTNLISNACKYTAKEGRIKIDVFREDQYHVVQVSDTGQGIPEDDLELIFSPFYRSKNADGSPYSGSGLGLSIARFLAELHEGQLVATSKIGVGSTFSLYLPERGPRSVRRPDSDRDGATPFRDAEARNPAPGSADTGTTVVEDTSSVATSGSASSV